LVIINSQGKEIYESLLSDKQGKKYLDASGGAAVVNIGHGVQEVAEAISTQSQTVAYLNGMHFSHSAAENLAEQISRFLPFPEGKIYFLTSGSEAIEASIKLARQYWVEKGHSKKFQVISRKPSYHGNTIAALSLSARQHYKEIFKPLLSENVKIPAPYCYRCPWQSEPPACGVKCAYELEESILRLGKENVAAFMTEIIGGAVTGASVPPGEYFQIIRKICDEYQVLLVADEIMTGIGRTGKWLACHHFDLVPDIIVMGKGLTGGYFPLSALGVKKNIVDSIFCNDKNFLHAQTYSHHPVGCAAGLATLIYINEKKLIERSSSTENLFKKQLAPLLEHPHVGDIRGKGLLFGIEFVRDKKKKTPFLRKIKYAENFLSKGLEKGLVLWINIGQADGVNGDLILLAPPFIITPEEINLIFDVLNEILSEMKDFQ
jgi:adenosylmethionine-8-amino-7-oxononanoate aminotransferase